MVFGALMLHLCWSSPLFLGATLYLLVSFVGIAALPGLGVLIIAVPFQGVLMAKQQKLQVGRAESEWCFATACKRASLSRRCRFL